MCWNRRHTNPDGEFALFDDLPVKRPEAVVLTEFADCGSDTIAPGGVVEQLPDFLVECIVELGLVV